MIQTGVNGIPVKPNIADIATSKKEPDFIPALFIYKENKTMTINLTCDYNEEYQSMLFELVEVLPVENIELSIIINGKEIETVDYDSVKEK